MANFDDDSEIRELEIISMEEPLPVVRKSFVATISVLVMIVFTCWLIRYPDIITTTVVSHDNGIAVDLNDFESKLLKPGQFVTIKFDERSEPIQSKVISKRDNRVVFENTRYSTTSKITIITADVSLLQRCATRVGEMLSFGK